VKQNTQKAASMAIMALIRPFKTPTETGLPAQTPIHQIVAGLIGTVDVDSSTDRPSGNSTLCPFPVPSPA
jgi:hypothetical protein